MTETEYRLEGSQSATLDVNGEATLLNIGPTYAGERWIITKFSVSTTPGNSVFRVFRGNDPTAPYQIDYTTKGVGDASETNVPLRIGETVSFKWENGSVGAIGVVRWEGQRFVPGNRGYQ